MASIVVCLESVMQCHLFGFPDINTEVPRPEDVDAVVSRHALQVEVIEHLSRRIQNLS